MRFSYLLTLLVFLSPLANATEKPEANIDLTPFASYRFGGDFDDSDSNTYIDLEDNAGFGLITAWEYDTNRQGEFLVSNYNTELESEDISLNSTDISITYAHIGGNIKLSDGLVPFWLSAGIGLTHLSPDNGQLKSETNFSANLGLNTKFAISDSVQLYLGGRVYGTFFDSDSEIFCDKNNCAIYVESDVWVQSELVAGISLSF